MNRIDQIKNRQADGQLTWCTLKLCGSCFWHFLKENKEKKGKKEKGKVIITELMRT